MKMKLIILVACCLSILVYVSCTQGTKTPENRIAAPDSLQKRGEYLVTIAGCGDCHSPKIMTPQGPVPDTTRLFSGHRAEAPALTISKEAFEKGWVLFNLENTALATPGFISYAANITSDSTGIGSWSFEQFKTALTKGKWKGIENSRALLPPMPWPNYAKMKEEDVRAVYEYLKTTKPVRNVVPAPQFFN